MLATLSIDGYTQADNTLRLSLGGMFGTTDIPALKDWAEHVGEKVLAAYASSGKKVRVLINIQKLEGYNDPMILTIFANLMQNDNPYVLKTASFGGNHSSEIAQDVIKAFAERDNLKNFKTEAEALAWLKA